MLTLQCFYCKLNQDEVPAHILSMVDDEPNKKRKTDIIKVLFDKSKNGSWEMNTEKPIFQQEVT